MTMYYVVEGTLVKPNENTQIFSEYNPQKAKEYWNELKPYILIYEPVRTTSTIIVWKTYYTSYESYQECQNVFLTQVERLEYEAEMGIVRTGILIGYIDVPT